MLVNRWIAALVLVSSIVGTLLWPVTSLAQDDLIVGPLRTFEIEGGRAVALSPDGTKHAILVDGDALCIYSTETLEEISCADLQPPRIGIRIEDVAWSPDSTRIALGENGFRFGRDADLWVMDAATGQLTNVTDDNYEGSFLSLSNDEEDEPAHYMDIAPAWTPDGQFITFSRSPVIDGEFQGNVLAQVPAAGGEVEILATIPDSEPGSIYWRMEWAPSGETLYFSLTHLDSDHPDNGIWTYSPATGEIAPLAFGDPELGPLTLLRVSPAGDRLLAWYPMMAGSFVTNDSLLRLVDVASGELSTVDAPASTSPVLFPTVSATFSPDGQMLLAVFPGEDGLFQAWALDLSGGEPLLLMDGIDDGWLALGVTPGWGTNGTVLAGGGGEGGGTLLTVEVIGLNAIPAPLPTTDGTPAIAPDSEFAAGSTVVANGIVPIFASPDPDATVVLVLTPGMEAQILGERVENESGAWYPILDPATQTIGYAQAERLAIAG